MIDQKQRHFSAYRGQLASMYHFKPGYVFLDLTLGDGGHTEEALSNGCNVISIDTDPAAIERATSFISSYIPTIIKGDDLERKQSLDGNRWVIINCNFNRISDVWSTLSLPLVDGLIADLGPSQFQILSGNRGLSFLSNEFLDMRLSPDLAITAADLLAGLNEGELVDLLLLGDERYAKPIAREIVKHRKTSPITTTNDLTSLVIKVKKPKSKEKIHPATQVFMALRIAVNLEFENIRQLLPQLPPLMVNGGTLGVISFHSGEDRLVKNFIKEMESKQILCAINSKPIIPTSKELSISQRTRSAKLRLAKKIN